MNKKPNGWLTEDEKFLAGKDDVQPFQKTISWQVMRVMGELVEGLDRLADVDTAVTIFGSARARPGDVQYETAVTTARLLGEAGFSIITGGGPGIMEAGNKGAKEAGVLSIGLNIQLPFEQHINPYVDISMEFRHFFTRKVLLIRPARGFVIFPGGFGTMDEMFEALTLIQTGKLKNFPVVLFDTKYWQGLLLWLKNTMLAEGKISPDDLDLLMLADSPQEAVDFIVRCQEDADWRIKPEAKAVEVTREVYAGVTPPPG